jgi:hypothetical protein
MVVWNRSGWEKVLGRSQEVKGGFGLDLILQDEDLGEKNLEASHRLLWGRLVMFNIAFGWEGWDLEHSCKEQKRAGGVS